MNTRFQAAAMLALTLAVNAFSQAAEATGQAVNLRLSVGNSWQVRNDVQIPNTDLGSRFSLAETVGEGPVSAVRFELTWKMNERHGLRVLLAPLSYTESVVFDDTVLFAGETFNPSLPTDASYTFNSWRIGYFYQLTDTEKFSTRVGATLKVRDAEIRLAQGNTISFDDDLGLVPLLYLAGNYKLNDQWSVGADLDGLAGGPGRAIDLGIGLDYALSNHWKVGVEARVLDGGADTETVYNFARFNSAGIVITSGF